MINLNRANLSLGALNTAINAAVEQASLIKHADDQVRGYLGASLIGDDCSRKIQFEWLTEATFSARVRSIFARGHYFEIESRQQLTDAGFVFAPIEALGFIAVDGLMAGHADGIIIAKPADAGIRLNLPALWEHKALNAKNYRAVERDGLVKTFPRYAAQVSLYQDFLGFHEPALITVTNADACERLHFTLEFDGRRAQEAVDRAVNVIEATRAGELLPPLDPSRQDFRCRMCSHLERCLRHD
jgi:hypothetical protein